jgi:glucose/arabinose dehydrogenase
MTAHLRLGCATVVAACAISAAACSRNAASSTTTTSSPTDPECLLVDSDFGPRGTASVGVDVVVSGLEVPWSMAFLPNANGDMLVTERAGRVRLVRGGALVPAPVVTVGSVQNSESGLLGLALDSSFASTRAFFLYLTVPGDNGPNVNRIVRYVLDPSGLTAREDRLILDGIPSATLHDGGRLRFGPDGMLYAGTGDATTPDNSQNLRSLGGKVLRLAPDGTIPGDNPFSGTPVFLLGVRNVQAFDWLDDGRLVLGDHGPSGELGRTGHDEINVAGGGENLGWPEQWGCDQAPGRVAPRLVWSGAVPPGGGLFYRGDAIAAWKNSFLVGTLGSKHLHRVVFGPGARNVVQHEVYFEGDPPSGYGRLRDVVAGPDGAVYVTTSNCDGRGTCPPTKDRILRITSR